MKERLYRGKREGEKRGVIAEDAERAWRVVTSGISSDYNLRVW